MSVFIKEPVACKIFFFLAFKCIIMFGPHKQNNNLKVEF